MGKMLRYIAFCFLVEKILGEAFQAGRRFAFGVFQAVFCVEGPFPSGGLPVLEEDVAFFALGGVEVGLEVSFSPFEKIIDLISRKQKQRRFGEMDGDAAVSQSLFQPVVADVEAVDLCNATPLEFGQEQPHIAQGICRIDVFHFEALPQQVFLIGLHRSPVKEEFLFMEGVLPEKQVFLHQQDPPFARQFPKQLVGEYEGYGSHGG